MILRRLAPRIRGYDWFAMAIELAVVVLGVFIALQASNWNDQRLQDHKADAFGQRLEEDLLVEALGYEMQVGYYSDVPANAEKAAVALTGKLVPADEALLVAAHRAEFRKTLPHAVHRAVSGACGDKIVAEGDFGSVVDSLDYPCSTALPPDVLAQSVAALRANPELVPLPRLRLLDVETSLFNLALYYKGLRESLAALASRRKPPAK